MLSTIKRGLPGALQRDIRNGRALSSSQHQSNDRSGLPSGLPAGWSEAFTPEGKAYYFHTASGETRWEKPAGAADVSDAAPPPSGGQPKAPTTAIVAKKPVIPVAPGVGKLPRGWRMIEGADGKAYYFNKKTGETSWEPPPPDGEDDADRKNAGEMVSDAKEKVVAGFRRARQHAAVKVFKAASTDDPELDSQYDQVLQVELQISGIKKAIEAYLASLVEMCWSAEQLGACRP